MTDNKYGEILADEYGALVEHLKELEEKKDKMRDELLQQVKDVPIEGLFWTVNKSQTKGRTTLDTKAIEELLGDDIKKYQKTGEPYDRLVLKPTKRFGKTAGNEDE
jgi:hypothetical protein